MNTSGEAADQVVRMSLEVGEAALKISGTGAKHLAVMLYAVLKEKKKTKGRARLETLVKSGRPLTVFSVKESDLKQFVQEAKRYGVLYCAVRNPKGSSDGLVDVIVKEEDANANKDALQRIMFNLISNAIRYGGDGKYLGMFLRADQAHIYIDIVDRGRGIEKEFADSVFERLFMMEDSRNSAMQGNGLGLTIAKNLALQLGGDITLESHPHLKTVFTITLKKMAY